MDPLPKILFALAAILGVLGTVFWATQKTPPHQVLPIVVASLALIVSGYTLWSTRLAPFRLEVEPAGTVILGADFRKAPQLESALKVNFNFLNRGAVTGSVTGVALVVQKVGTGRSSYVFHALAENRSDTLGLTPPPHGAPVYAQFAAFAIKPGEAVLKSFVFVTYGEPRETRFPFQEGRFSAVVFVSSSLSAELKESATLEFEIEKADMDVLSANEAEPHPDGGFMLQMKEQIKITVEREDALKRLSSAHFLAPAPTTPPPPVASPDTP